MIRSFVDPGNGRSMAATGRKDLHPCSSVVFSSSSTAFRLRLPDPTPGLAGQTGKPVMPLAHEGRRIFVPYGTKIGCSADGAVSGIEQWSFSSARRVSGTGHPAGSPDGY